MVIPIQQKKEGVLDKAAEVRDALKAAGIRAKMDDSEKSPGWKFSEQEMRGIPVRVELGPKDIAAGQAVVVRRDTREKITVAIDELAANFRRSWPASSMTFSRKQRNIVTAIPMRLTTKKR